MIINWRYRCTSKNGLYYVKNKSDTTIWPSTYLGLINCSEVKRIKGIYEPNWPWTLDRWSSVDGLKSEAIWSCYWMAGSTQKTIVIMHTIIAKYKSKMIF